MADELLAISLDAAVPLYIQQLQAAGGPTDADIERCHEFAPVLAERGDVLQFHTKAIKGQRTAAELFNELAYCVAVMAFAPGGIELFGSHWEAGA